MSRVKELWEEQAEFYNEMHLGDITYHASQAVILDLLPKNRASSVPDLGASTGQLAERILQTIPRSSVTCLDFTSKMIEQCRSRLAGFGDRVTLACDNLMTWDPPAKYDAVVSCNALIDQELDLWQCYQKYAAVLQPQGLWINSTVVEIDTRFHLVCRVRDYMPVGCSTGKACQALSCIRCDSPQQPVTKHLLRLSPRACRGGAWCPPLYPPRIWTILRQAQDGKA